MESNLSETSAKTEKAPFLSFYFSGCPYPPPPWVVGGAVGEGIKAARPLWLIICCCSAAAAGVDGDATNIKGHCLLGVAGESFRSSWWWSLWMALCCCWPGCDVLQKPLQNIRIYFSVLFPWSIIVFSILNDCTQWDRRGWWWEWSFWCFFCS